MPIHLIIIFYLTAINIAGFLLMFIDKNKAQRHIWRIPESTLFMTAIFGGSLGSILGMYTFRHKTKHMSFVIGLPLILILQIALTIFFVFYSPIQIRIM